MGTEYKARVFKSGNSLALRLPKALGLHEGDEMVLRDEGGQLVIEPMGKPQRTIDLTGIVGACPDIEPFTREERLFDPSPRPPGWGEGDDADQH